MNINHPLLNREISLSPLPLRQQKRSNWRERSCSWMPPLFPMLMFSLTVTAFLLEDYFLLEVLSVGVCSVSTAKWLSQNRSRFPWIPTLFNQTNERLIWIAYSIVGVLSIVEPVRAAGTPGGGGCTATNTILGPIADALIGVFNSSAQIGSTGTIGDNLCQVFTTFAAIIALLIIGSVLWGLFDNQVRGSDIGKAFAPLGLVLAGVVVTRISIKLVMGV